MLVGAGFSEAYTWSLTPVDPDPDALRLPDPMSGEHAVLRTTLLHGLVEAARVNVDAGNDDIRLFELARVYLPSGEQLPEERWRVGGIAEGGFEAARAAVEAVHEAFHLPLVVRRASLDHLHPGKAAETDAGWLGELHPTLLDGRWGVFELDVARLMAPVPERILYEDVITYPASRQDIAVAVAEDVEAGAVVAVAHEAGGAELREARVFDVYRGDQVGGGEEVRRRAPGLPGTRPDAHGRGGQRGARPDRRRARRPLRRRAARLTQDASHEIRFPRGRVVRCMRRRHGIVMVGLAVLVLASSAGAAETKLVGTVGPGFTIELRDAQGQPVKQLQPGVGRDRGVRSLRGARLPSPGPGGRRHHRGRHDR